MAKIFDIKHFAVHDGLGIRTTVFLKGCPLECIWCHNPESISGTTQLAYSPDKCVGCKRCTDVCRNGVHLFDGEHKVLKENCVTCRKCEKVCPGSAITVYGRDVSVTDIMSEVLEDKDFYETSGGGVTLSGGECLVQADFCAEFLESLKREGINTAVDTCGFVSQKSIDKVIPYTDIFLYDIKAIDEDVHIKCTGQSNKLILENLRYLDDVGKEIEIRIPYVPDYNDNQMEKIAHFIKDFKNIKKVRVLPYHSYARSKYLSLQMKNTLPEKVPDKDEIAEAKNMIRKITNFVVPH